MFTQSSAMHGFAAALVSASVALAVADAAVTYETRVLAGNPAPGAGPGVVFKSLTTEPIINGSGQILFSAEVDGPGVDAGNWQGLWREAGGAMTLVARAGDPAPGAGDGITYRYIGDASFNGSGRVTFRAALTGGVARRGIWTVDHGVVSPIAIETHPAPGTDQVFSELDDYAVFNHSGQFAIGSSFYKPGSGERSRYGIWGGSVDAPRLIARKGDPIPGTSAVFADFLRNHTVLNDAGQIAFYAGIYEPGVGNTDDGAIWLDDNGTLSMIARYADHAPGAGSGVFFRGLYHDYAINSLGQAAFVADLAGEGVDGTNNFGIWSEGGGTSRMLARTGEHAPGTGKDLVFDVIDSPVLNRNGDTAFAGLLRGPGVHEFNNKGLWLNRGGVCELIMREGGSPPGAGPGVVFHHYISAPVLNGAGQVAFEAQLIGPDMPAPDSRGVWATDPAGRLKLIAMTGSVIDVNQDPLIDDLRTVSFVTFLAGNIFYGGQHGESGRPMTFNDAGQLVFLAGFTDGSSGIFVATVPEPGIAMMIGVGLVWMTRRRG